MPEVTISPKYQIVIPKEVREKLGLKPGQKLQLLQVEHEIRVLIPRPISALRGIAKGIRWNHEEDRDHTDRF